MREDDLECLVPEWSSIIWIYSQVLEELDQIIVRMAPSYTLDDLDELAVTERSGFEETESELCEHSPPPYTTVAQ